MHKNEEGTIQRQIQTTLLLVLLLFKGLHLGLVAQVQGFPQLGSHQPLSPNLASPTSQNICNLLRSVNVNRTVAVYLDDPG